MSEARDPIAALEERLLDDPHGPGLDEALAVVGDYLQSRGNVRGELIVHEQALASARDQVEQRHRQAQLDTWLDAHETLVFGTLTWLRKPPSTIRYELRGGQLRGLYVDARRALQRSAGMGVASLMQAIVGARACRKLVELRVRVRNEQDAATALETIEKAGRRLPLEWLMVSPTTRPLDHQTRGHAVELRKHFPHLWLVTRYARLAPLLDPELPDQTTAYELGQFVGAPMSQELRIRIGRGLTSGREHTTKVACELLAGLGPSGRVFLPTLDLLLRPNVSHAAGWVLAALPSLGPWALALRRRVASMSGDIGRYPPTLRSLAGVCLRELDRAYPRTGP